MQNPLNRSSFFIALAGLAVVSVIFSGCSKNTDLPNSADLNGTQETDTQMGDDTANQMTPLSSPAAPAKDTNEAAVNEGAQLDALNKDSTSVDQGFNDQAINVQ